MRNTNVRKMVVTAIMGAIAAVLMQLSFSIPLMPGFIKLDFSDLPALVAAFALGPVSGVAVSFIKCLIHLFVSATNGVGTLTNFLMAVCLVLPAGIIYKKSPTRKGAVIGSLVGAAIMALGSLPVNYYIAYPFYETFMPMDSIIKAYQVINPKIENLWQALLIFNMPFTFLKGIFNAIITFIIYKKIAPILKGK